MTGAVFLTLEGMINVTTWTLLTPRFFVFLIFSQHQNQTIEQQPYTSQLNSELQDLLLILDSDMAIVSDEATSFCSHCDRAVPSPNIELHYAHCSRNLERCEVCGEMVPKKHAEEHYLSTHAPVACSLCMETVERETLDVHEGENCPKRIVTCEYCEFPLPAIDLFKHQEVCGNRTEYCHLCRRYIRLCNRYVHETSCNGVSEDSVGSSRDARASEREQRRRRQPQRVVAGTHLFFTIAITGIAVILGSFFFQRKASNDELH